MERHAQMCYSNILLTVLFMESEGYLDPINEKDLLLSSMSFYLVLRGPLQLFRKAGITMGLEQSTTEHQINSLQLVLFSCDMLDWWH